MVKRSNGSKYSFDIKVHVSGALKHPGIYTIKVGTRIHELISSLELKNNADISHLNLAKPCRDGQKIVIKVKKGEVEFLNINMATKHQLMQLPGIGKQTAKKIMEYRDNYGSIKNRKVLSKIVGEKKEKRIQTNIGF